MKIFRSFQARHVLILFWIAGLIAGLIWMDQHNLSFRELFKLLRVWVQAHMAWAPLVVVGLYVLRVFVFAPTTILILLTGSLFGPLWGVLLTILGENVSAMIAFYLGRFFGRSFVAARDQGWVQRYDQLLTKNGFLPILLMRLLFFPFDVVNYGAGMTGIVYRQFAVATFLGLIPSAVTLNILGDAFGKPRSFLFFLCLNLVIVVAAFWLQRSDWVRRKLKEEPLTLPAPHE
jgi:uncharacterized membrane protein YdjX (TVP38/TMEM64 family)